MRKLQSIFPSDKLKELTDLARRHPAFAHLVQDLIQVWFIVDASIIQEQLRWRLGKRTKPHARSNFQEAVESGIFIPVAPPHLKVEIEKHLCEIAAETGSTLEQAESEWGQLQSHIHLYPLSHLNRACSDVVDPDDLPYKQASDELGVAVYSRDKHFRSMKVPLIAVCLDLSAREHARAASVTLGATINSTFTITFAFGAFGAFCKLVKNLFILLARLPKPVQFLAAALLAGLLIHPKSRAKILSGARAIYNKAAELGPETLGLLSELVDEVVGALTEVEKTRVEIKAALPVPRKRSALMHIRAILTISKVPLSIGELAERLQTQGYVSRAQDFKAYLRRVMRKSGQFLEVSRGVWRLRTIPANAT